MKNLKTKEQWREGKIEKTRQAGFKRD